MAADDDVEAGPRRRWGAAGRLGGPADEGARPSGPDDDQAGREAGGAARLLTDDDSDAGREVGGGARRGRSVGSSAGGAPGLSFCIHCWSSPVLVHYSIAVRDPNSEIGLVFGSAMLEIV